MVASGQSSSNVPWQREATRVLFLVSVSPCIHIRLTQVGPLGLEKLLQRLLHQLLHHVAVAADKSFDSARFTQAVLHMVRNTTRG